MNLASDPHYSKTMAQLRSKLQQWGRETNDVMPARRTPDEFDRESGEPLPGRKLPRPSKQEMNRAANSKQ
jgi:N-sulfoglucosamine sulfohydrolase